MNIQFTLSAKTFLEAAEIEEILKNNSIKYHIEGKINGTKRKPYTRKSINGTGIRQKRIVDGRKPRQFVDDKTIKTVLADGKKMTITQLVKKHDISRATVSRIISGTHTLQLAKLKEKNK